MRLQVEINYELTQNLLDDNESKENALHELIKFTISCLMDNGGESLGCHDHLGDVSEWAFITLKKIGYTETEINNIIEENRYKHEYVK